MTTTEHYFRRAPCRLRTDFHLQKLIKTFIYGTVLTLYIVYHVVSLCIKSFSFAEQSTRTVRTTIHIFIISLYVLPVLNRIHHPQATSSGVQYRVPYCTGYRMLYSTGYASRNDHRPIIPHPHKDKKTKSVPPVERSHSLGKPASDIAQHGRVHRLCFCNSWHTTPAAACGWC